MSDVTEWTINPLLTYKQPILDNTGFMAHESYDSATIIALFL